VNIFNLGGHFPNASAIEECAAVFFAEAVAVRDLGWIIEDIEVDRSPSFVDDYMDLLLGGVDDMAVWSARTQERLAGWVSNGPPPPASLPPDAVPVPGSQSFKPTTGKLAFAKQFV